MWLRFDSTCKVQPFTHSLLLTTSWSQGHTEIGLAFYSLPRIFKDVQVDIASIQPAVQPRQPAFLKGKGYEQVCATSPLRCMDPDIGCLTSCRKQSQLLLHQNTSVYLLHQNTFCVPASHSPAGQVGRADTTPGPPAT